MPIRTVFMYGPSMLLSLLASSLGQNPGLQVFQGADWGEIVAFADAYTPDVLIYDLPGAAEGNLLPLLHRFPHLLLVGLDVETNRAVLIVGQETRSLTLERLQDMIASAPILEQADARLLTIDEHIHEDSGGI